ncbi:hypothetical protein [Ralstonia soli]|uniref:Transmembrane protein n=1 Tax=Ralstonia soli TaxID=2953896 RepID=A0ABT1AM57_9RALS|nr:hypothetical protein [Ralstonia soli]MCO5399517.1 hypothetical protein [Ralstonia soli]
MPNMQPHPTHHTRPPRAHRDAMPTPMSYHASRGKWHAYPAGSTSREPEMVCAQTVFYVARGVAVLLAAVAVGMGAMSDDTANAPNPPPASSQATAR